MEHFQFSQLLDVYGGMLTEKQRSMASQHYHLDYSLAEIAQNEGISRQAVHASLRQAQHTLTRLEAELGLCAKRNQILVQLRQARQSQDIQAVHEALDRIETLL